MQTEHLAIIRSTKLDLARWIATGIGKCSNPETSLCLARYAAAQLESAAIIPMSPPKLDRRIPASLLRRELRTSVRPDSSECAMIISRVSRAMLTLLAGAGSADATAARLIKHEATASSQIRALCRECSR